MSLRNRLAYSGNSAYCKIPCRVKDLIRLLIEMLKKLFFIFGCIWLNKIVTFRSSHQRCSTATLVKKRLWHRCFPVNFVKFLRTPFCTDYLWWLLLVILTRIDWELLSLKRSVKLEIFELQQEICMTIHHTGVDLGVGNGLRPLYS